MLEKLLRIAPVPGLVLGFYLITVMQPRYENAAYRNSYNLVVDAWLRGRVDLGVELDPEFLRDPYSFSDRVDYILQKGIIDLSVYRGKLYSYFGVGPVATLYLPYKMLTGKDLPDQAAVFLFGLGGFLFGALLLMRMRALFFPSTPLWATETSLLVFGFCSMLPPLIRFSNVYEVAVASGMFYLMGAMYFCVTGLSAGRPNVSRLSLGSLMMGLSIASRPHFAVICLVWQAWLLRDLFRRPAPLLSRVRWALADILPLSAVCGLLAWHNAARFGDAFEFGATYQISPLNPGAVGMLFDAVRVPLGLYFYLFNPPAVMGHFPFYYASEAVPPFLRWPAGTYVVDGGTIGLFANVPFTWVALLAPVLLAQRRGIFWGRSGCLMSAVKASAYYFFGIQLILGLLKGLTSSAAFSRLSRILELVQMEIPLLFVFGAALWVYCIRSARPWRAPGQLLFVGVPVLVLVPLLSAHQSVNFRYPADFTGPAILAASWVWLELDARLEGDPLRRGFLRSFAVLLGVISVALAFCHSVNFFSAF